MRKYTLSVRSVVAALMVSFISKAVLAATPIAVWDGDFSTLTKGGITINVNGNTLAQDNSSIAVSGSNGILLNSATAGGMNVVTVVTRCSGIDLNSENNQVIYAMNNNNLVGVYLAANNAAAAGIWSGGLFTPNASHGTLTQGSIPAGYTSLIINHRQTEGAHVYAYDGTTLTTLYSLIGLRSSGTSYTQMAIGGLSGATSDTIKPAQGLTITSIAIFQGTLSNEEMKAFRFDSEYSEESISGTVRISGLEEKIGDVDTAINLEEGTSIIVDKVFDTKEKAVSIRSDYDVEFVLGSNTTEDMLKSVIANTSVNIDVARLVFDVSKGFTISDQALKDKIRTSGLTYVFKGEGTRGLTLEYALNVGSQIVSHLVFEGGTHAFKFGNSVGNGTSLFATGHSNDNPTIRVKNETVLNFTAKDLSGWSGGANASGVIRVDKGGKLNLIQSGDNDSCFYRQRFYLEPGSYMSFNCSKPANGEGRFRLQGGTAEDTAQIYVPSSEDADSEPAVIEQLGESQIILASDATRGLAIFIGENSKLKLDAELQTVLSNDAGLAKYGEGTLILKRTFSPHSFKFAAGTLSVDNDLPIELYNGGSFSIEGNVTIDVPENRILNIKSNITTTEGASLSKLGAGKLVIATSRPNFAALEGTLQVVANDDEIALGRVDIPTTMSDRQLSTSGFIVRPANKPTLDLMDAKVSGGHILLTFANGAGIKVTGFDFDYGNGLTNLTMTATVNLEKNHSLVTGNKLSAVVSLVTAEGHKTTSEATALTVKDDKVVVTLPVEFDGLQGEIASYTVTIRDSSGNLVGSVTTTDVGAWDRGNKWIDEKPYQRWGTGNWDYENELVVSNGYIIVNGDLSFTPKNAEKSDLVKLAFSVDFGDPIAFETAEEKLGGKKLGIVMISEGLENAYTVVADNGSVSRVYPSTIDKKVESGIVHDVEIIIDQRSKKVSYLVDSAVLTTVDNKAIFDLPVDSISEIDFGSYGLVKAVEGSELSDALAKVGEQEYRSVAEAIAASSDGKVEILWPATWTPGNIAAIGEDDEIGETTIEFSGKPVIVPDSVANGYWNAGMVLVKDSDTKYTITSKYLTISIIDPMSGSKKPVYIESVKTNSTMVAWKYNYGKDNENTARAKIIYGDNVTITFSNDLEDGANGALLFARNGAVDGSGKPIEGGLQIKEVIFHNVKSDTEVDLRYIPTLGELEETARAKVMALYDYGVAAAQALPDTSLDIIDFTASADGVTFRVSALEGMTDEAKKLAVGKLVKFSSDLKNWAYVSADDSITINEDGSITVRQIGSSGFYKVEITEE